jgi:ComF family protein
VFGPFVEALFPMRCAGCGRGAWPFCPECVRGIVVLSPPWCRRCGAPSTRSPPTCRDCPPLAVALSRAPFGFVGPVRRAVHRLKFGGWRPVADALSIAMVGAWEGAPWGPPDAVTWVPLSRRRLATRGYDQARALASAVAPRLGVPRVRLLRRVGDAGPQARRGGTERRQAMRGVFAADEVSGRILLVDDVLTTGATAGACAEALRAAGASDVALLTAARSIASVRAAGASAYTRGGLASGSVVAPGNGSPAVDASRGRSDPRKPTLGR